MNPPGGPAVFVKVTAPTLERVLPFARENDLDLEIVDLIKPQTFWESFDGVREAYTRALAGHQGTLSLHGPFIDLYLHSLDPTIARIAREATERTLDLCDQLGVHYVIFHGNFVPLIPDEAYRQHWVEAHASFWSRAVRDHDCGVVLENLWDPDPSLFAALLERVAEPGFGICLDIGHCTVYSTVPLEDWFTALGPRIHLLHLNDNDGEQDLELVPGSGATDWAHLTELVERHCDAPAASLELSTLEEVREALDYMRGNGVYPFR